MCCGNVLPKCGNVLLSAYIIPTHNIYTIILAPKSSPKTLVLFRSYYYCRENVNIGVPTHFLRQDSQIEDSFDQNTSIARSVC